MQTAERVTIDTFAELARCRVRRSGQGAGGHHIDFSRESRLRHDLSRRMQQQREACARVVDEPPQRRFDPRLDRRDDHSNDSSALKSSTRIKPTFAAGSATTTMTKSLPPPTAHTLPRSASSWRNATAPSCAASADNRALRYIDAASAATRSPSWSNRRLESTTSPSFSETIKLARTPRWRVSDSSIDRKGVMSPSPFRASPWLVRRIGPRAVEAARAASSETPRRQLNWRR